jgi:hypothetical protein
MAGLNDGRPKRLVVPFGEPEDATGRREHHGKILSTKPIAAALGIPASLSPANPQTPEPFAPDDLSAQGLPTLAETSIADGIRHIFRSSSAAIVTTGRPTLIHSPVLQHSRYTRCARSAGVVASEST